MDGTFSMRLRRLPHGILVLALLVAVVGGSSILLLENGSDTEDAAPNASASSEFAFREVSDETGVNYTVTEDGTENGGVYTIDYDRDGWTDLLAVGGQRVTLFENERGQFERSGDFPNRSAKSALVFDYDGDGESDVLLLKEQSEPVFLENDGGQFRERDVGFDRSLDYPIGATAADFDGNGCLDVFVVQYEHWSDSIPAGGRPENLDVSTAQDNGGRNLLYSGDCSGFQNATGDSGIRGETWSLATSAVDFTGDGLPDIHVANDFNNDVIYVNRGNATFERVVLGSETNRNAMSSELADIDGDGRLDIFVTNIYLPPAFTERMTVFQGRTYGNNVLVNQGNGSFVDRSSEYNVSRGGWGWAAILEDFDNDGDRDLFHTTDYMRIPPNLRDDLDERGYPIEEYRRDHPYLGHPRFWERTASEFEPRNASRIGFEPTSGTGAAVFDMDNDGDLDIVLAQTVGPLKLYENIAGENAGNTVQIDLERGNTSSVLGTRIYVKVDDRTQMRVHTLQTGFISQDTRLLHVGAGDRSTVEELRVVWPDGRSQTFSDVEVNARYRISPGQPLNRTREL